MRNRGGFFFYARGLVYINFSTPSPLLRILIFVLGFQNWTSLLCLFVFCSGIFPRIFLVDCVIYMSYLQVAGNFHLSPGKSFAHNGMFMHDLQSLDPRSFNISHVFAPSFSPPSSVCQTHQTHLVKHIKHIRQIKHIMHDLQSLDPRSFNLSHVFGPSLLCTVFCLSRCYRIFLCQKLRNSKG